MEDRTYTIAEIKEMCLQSYIRGMSMQYDVDMKINRRNIPKAFNIWVEELINTCPKNKFK
jgi:hypothetical protein